MNFKKNLTMSESTRNTLKWITLVLLPATSMLYLALAPLWNLPYPNEIAGTIAAIDAFLGLLLGLVKDVKSTFKSINITHSNFSPLVLSTNVYDILKWSAQISLPAVAALYFTLANTWSLPNPDQVVATIMAVVTFLGMILQLSNSNYKSAVSQ